MDSIIEKDLQLLEQVLKDCNIKFIPSKDGASINGIRISIQVFFSNAIPEIEKYDIFGYLHGF